MRDLIKRLRDASFNFDDNKANMFEAADTLDRMRWQPIDTAPKDGSAWLLVLSPEGCQLAWWSDGQDDWLSQDGRYLWDDPTHWMHIPTPPPARIPNE